MKCPVDIIARLQQARNRRNIHSLHRSPINLAYTQCTRCIQPIRNLREQEVIPRNGHKFRQKGGVSGCKQILAECQCNVELFI